MIIKEKDGSGLLQGGGGRNGTCQMNQGNV